MGEVWTMGPRLGEGRPILFTEVKTSFRGRGTFTNEKRVRGREGLSRNLSGKVRRAGRLSTSDKNAK